MTGRPTEEDVHGGLTVTDGKLILHVQGLDELWPLRALLKSRFSTLLAFGLIRSGACLVHGVRMPGTNIPESLPRARSIKMVSGYSGRSPPDKTIVIDLRNEKYQQLIVEMADLRLQCKVKS